uniref:Protein containing PKc-like domain n=1 Tax=Rhipicephalus zambeziensis TaxID=60191 RepID=A0A224Z1A6_9ACAR
MTPWYKGLQCGSAVCSYKVPRRMFMLGMNLPWRQLLKNGFGMPQQGTEMQQKRLDHPHIIKYFTSFLENGELFIVLELADGGDLAQFL